MRRQSWNATAVVEDLIQCMAAKRCRLFAINSAKKKKTVVMGFEEARGTLTIVRYGISSVTFPHRELGAAETSSSRERIKESLMAHQST